MSWSLFVDFLFDFFSNTVLPFKQKVKIYLVDYAWKGYPQLRIWTFFQTATVKSYATTWSLKSFSNKSGHDATFVTAQLSMFLLLVRPSSKFLPSSLRVWPTREIRSTPVLTHFLQVSVSLWQTGMYRHKTDWIRSCKILLYLWNHSAEWIIFLSLLYTERE